MFYSSTTKYTVILLVQECWDLTEEYDYDLNT